MTQHHLTADYVSMEYVPLESKVRTENSVFASGMLSPEGYALTRYRFRRNNHIETIPFCAASSVEDLAGAFFALKTPSGKPYDVSLAIPKPYDTRYFPLITIGGVPSMVQMGHPSQCLTFEQPALWRSADQARDHEYAMPRMTLDEQALFLSLLLTRAKKP